MQDRELAMVGTLMYQKADYLRAIELVASGKLRLGEMVTQRFPFDQYLDAYKAIDREVCHSLIGKVMIIKAIEMAIPEKKRLGER